MPEVKIDIINDKELLKLFNELQTVYQNRVIQQGLRKAAQPILQQAKQNFNTRKKNKSKTGYKDLSKYFKIEGNRDKTGVKIGVKNYYKARWIEWGTVDRYYKTKRNKTEHFTGKIVATHFFYDAVETKKNEAQQQVSKCIIDALNKLVAKYDK